MTTTTVPHRVEPPADPAYADLAWLSPAHRDRAELTLRIAAMIAALSSLLLVSGLINGLDAAASAQVYASTRWLNTVGLGLEAPGLRSFIYPLALGGAGWVAWRHRDARILLTTTVALFLVNALTSVGKFLTARATPRQGGPEAYDPEILGSLGAFPSGHAANIAAVVTLALLLAPSTRRTRLLLAVPLLSMSLTSWARGTHWVSDLVAGLAVGAIAASAAVLLANRAFDESHRLSRVPVRTQHAGAALMGLALTVAWMKDNKWDPSDLIWAAAGLCLGLLLAARGSRGWPEPAVSAAYDDAPGPVARGSRGWPEPAVSAAYDDTPGPVAFAS